MTILGLKSVKINDSLYIYNKNLNNNFSVTCDNIQMIRADDIPFIFENSEKQLRIKFHPLNQQKESCSRLIINDSIHLYLRNIVYNLFTKIITIKDGTDTHTNEKYNIFDINQLGKLPNPTKYRWYNLFNILSATSFSKNFISFSIDLNSSKDAEIEFKYPLYEALNSIQNNTLFGIYLEDVEIELFKQIYENYIINSIDDLFKDPIKIPENSRKYPYFYILLTMKVKLEEAFWKQYNISYIWDIKRNLPQYYEMLANLNQFTNMLPPISKEQQELDLQSYKNELEIRKASEPNWLLLKDNIMQENLNTKQKAIIVDTEEQSVVRKILDQIKKEKKIYNEEMRKFYQQVNIQIDKENYQKFINNQKWLIINNYQKLVINLLEETGGALWFDERIKKYCFRSKSNGAIVEKNQNEIGELLSKALKKNIEAMLKNYHLILEIVLVTDIKSISKKQLNTKEESDNAIKIFLFVNEITTIDDDVFDINNNDEFFKEDYNDLLYTRNRFVPTKYLRKRYCNNFIGTLNNQEQSFIEKFIYLLVKEDQTLFDYVVNWLAYYFQKLHRTKTALVLIGDQEVTRNMFWNLIIKEVFGNKYCTTISDNEHETTLVSDIARDKLFFNIEDIDDASTKFDDKTLALIIKELLIRPYVADSEDSEVNIQGQMIITATNPAPYLKKALSKCTVIEVNDMKTIINKLDLEDDTELEDKILEDLDSFTDILLQYSVRTDSATNKIDTEARKILKSNTSPNIDKDEIDNHIKLFIQAIKTSDLDYFERVSGSKDEHSNDLYEEIEYAFKKDTGYFIYRDLYLYFNAIYNQTYKTNTAFTNRLKEKDEMFNQEVKTLKILDKDKNEQVLFQSYQTFKETSNKELYKITNYKMAKDIIITSGATVISSQDNLQRFAYEDAQDIDNCIKRTKEYRAKKTKEKEQK